MNNDHLMMCSFCHFVHESRLVAPPWDGLLPSVSCDEDRLTLPAKAKLRIHMPTPANANAPQFRGAAPDDPDKEDDLTYDVGNLACFDTHPISLQEVNAQGGLSTSTSF